MLRRRLCIFLESNFLNVFAGIVFVGFFDAQRKSI